MTKTPHSGKIVICEEMLNFIHNDVSYFQQIVEIIIPHFIVDLSEYEHFLDKEDFLSNKSSTSYSCKSGFTVARKLRSLNRERDKFKMMNNLKNSEKNKIDKIEDKLINIVNQF